LNKSITGASIGRRSQLADIISQKVFNFLFSLVTGNEFFDPAGNILADGAFKIATINFRGFRGSRWTEFELSAESFRIFFVFNSSDNLGEICLNKSITGASIGRRSQLADIISQKVFNFLFSLVTSDEFFDPTSDILADSAFKITGIHSVN